MNLFPAPLAFVEQASQAVVAGTQLTLTPNRHALLPVLPGSAIISTATPLLPAGRGGQVIQLLNITSSALNTFTIRDNATLVGSGLRLSAASIALGKQHIIQLVYVEALALWLQLGAVLIPI